MLAQFRFYINGGNTPGFGTLVVILKIYLIALSQN